MLTEFLKSKHVIFDLHVNNKKHLFQELSFKSSLIDKNIDDKELFNGIINREKLGNTYIGNGAAIPSAMLENLSNTFILFSVLTKPIDYNLDDQKKVDIICLVVSPKKSTSKHLYFLSNFSRILKHDEITKRIRGCDNPDSLKAVIMNFNLSSAA
ncbi:MAG: hypothetical protein CMN37_07870 [SAR116 cluster bacterium]|nr:hypothetical protein [SAR116 cluster bacterium]